MTSYAQIEKDLPTIVKIELQKMDDIQRQLFAEEFNKKKRTLFHSYGFLVFFFAHRWYLGNPWMTVAQWIALLMVVPGIIWIIVDLFLIPGMRRDRNAEIAKTILTEHRMLLGMGNANMYAQPQHQPPTVISVNNMTGMP